jgi:hypothetical protein
MSIARTIGKAVLFSAFILATHNEAQALTRTGDHRTVEWISINFEQLTSFCSNNLRQLSFAIMLAYRFTRPDADLAVYARHRR